MVSGVLNSTTSSPLSVVSLSSGTTKVKLDPRLIRILPLITGKRHRPADIDPAVDNHAPVIIFIVREVVLSNKKSVAFTCKAKTKSLNFFI
jgi:hypothetical protein